MGEVESIVDLPGLAAVSMAYSGKVAENSPLTGTNAAYVLEQRQTPKTYPKSFLVLTKLDRTELTGHTDNV